jgi:hypothetical protein
MVLGPFSLQDDVSLKKIEILSRSKPTFNSDPYKIFREIYGFL